MLLFGRDAPPVVGGGTKIHKEQRLLEVRMKTLIILAALASFTLASCAGGTAEPIQIEPAPTDMAQVESAHTEADHMDVEKIGEMPVERAAHQATLLTTGQVLITGGCGGVGCDLYLDSVELFEPATRTFQPAAPMSMPRAGHAAVALSDGRVLVCGGWTGEGPTASAEIYDPASGQWTTVGEMNDARESLMAILLPDGRVLVTGGSGGQEDLASADVFDPATSTFSAVGPMGSNHYLATLLADGRVLLTGGESDSGEILRSAEIFDPATNQFQPTGKMRTPRVKHAGALLPDGKVLIIGGSDTRGFASRFTSTEIYDPATGTFLPGPNMNFGRHKMRDAVTVLPSRFVLVAGGAVRLELFNPDEEIFLPVEGELSGPQMFATATLLPGGEVLVLGGYDDRTRSSATAWLVHSGSSP
jgi:Kelch motif/Galactose oxidase, central domain